MLDVSHILNQSENVKIFYTQGSTAWQTWTKPRKCNFIWMMCIGGGGGGEGASRVTSGNGGASGGITRAIFPANLLPDILYVQPGVGGAGGAGNNFLGTNTAGGTATRSFVSIAPTSANTANIVCVSGNAASAGTTVETAATTAGAGLLSLGNFISTAGTYTAGTPITPLTLNILSPGTRGGTATIAAGTISSVNFSNTTTPTLTGGNPEAGDSTISGIWSWKPMYGLGAIGGAGTNISSVAGKGANAIAYGCGGGGGGCGNSSTQNVLVGADGGRGGDGLVIIAAL